MKKLLLVVLAVLALVSPALAAQTVLVSWTNNANNATAIYIYRKSEACAASTLTFGAIGNADPSATSWVDVSVAGGVTYCYRIYAVNTAGPSTGYAQAEVSVPVPVTIPNAPSNATAVVQP